MTDPDFDKLTALNDELDKLVDDGKATKKEFDRILAEAKEAVGEDSEFLEGLTMRGVELGFIK